MSKRHRKDIESTLKRHWNWKDTQITDEWEQMINMAKVSLSMSKISFQ